MPSSACQSYLDSFINYELRPVDDPARTFKPQRIRACLCQLGNPQQRLKCIHIAGTKGKGSTAVFLAHILCCAGFRVGLYTSPHLYELNERIRILNPGQRGQAQVGLFPDAITDRELGALLAAKKPVLEEFRCHPEFGALTYFELLTALAFCYFNEQQADFAVLETGLGGRLDATNVVDPFVCGLTTIGFDHTAQLGSTLEQIACEKVAIVKPGKPVVVAPQAPEVATLIREHGLRNRNRMIYIGEEINVAPLKSGISGQSFRVRHREHVYDLSTGLKGSFQLVNAAVAVGLAGVIREKGFPVPVTAVKDGIAQAVWPGRFEVLSGEKTVVLDAAHNPDSMRTLAENAKFYFPEKKIILVLGMSRDKDIEGICRIAKTFSNEVIPARADHPRAYDFSDPVIRQLLDLGSGAIPLTGRAVEKAVSRGGPEDVILITGSIFIVAEARKILMEGIHNHA